MGRNIWQSEHPVAMIRAIRAIVHDKATVKEALDVMAEAKRSTVAPVASRVPSPTA